MFVYLDNWSLIPILFIWIINLTIFGVSSKSETRKVCTEIERVDILLAICFKVHPTPSFHYKPESLAIKRIQNIDDDETTHTKSIFLNSTMAVFFPSCHLHISPPHTLENDIKYFNEKVEKIKNWQVKVYQSQVIIINSIYMVILAVIFCLVTISKSFNYNSNILDPFWFNTCVILSFLSGFIR